MPAHANPLWTPDVLCLPASIARVCCFSLLFVLVPYSVLRSAASVLISPVRHISLLWVLFFFTVYALKGYSNKIVLSPHIKEHLKLCNNLFLQILLYLTMFRRLFVSDVWLCRQIICLFAFFTHALQSYAVITNTFCVLSCVILGKALSCVWLCWNFKEQDARKSVDSLGLMGRIPSLSTSGQKLIGYSDTLVRSQWWYYNHMANWILEELIVICPTVPVAKLRCPTWQQTPDLCARRFWGRSLFRNKCFHCGTAYKNSLPV